jgi:hypothetical protein
MTTQISRHQILGMAQGQTDEEANENPDLLSLTMDGLRVVHSHVYEPHSRGSNWVATVSREPTAHGGLKRTFWNRDRGEDGCYVVPASICEGDVIELGADYRARSGRLYKKRLYAKIVAITEEGRIIGWVETTAIKATKVEVVP